MSWTDIHVDDYGWIGKLTLKQDGTAVDLSGYSTLQMIFIAPDGTAATKTAAFDSDGRDGIIKYTIQNGDIDAAGDWKVFARVAGGGAEITTNFISFHVQEREDA